MTMYLPNRDVRPTGDEPAEFIDAHRAGTPGDLRSEDPPRRLGEPTRLDRQTHLDIVHWAQQYVARLVERHRGGDDDVRAIVHDLHLQTNLIGIDGGQESDV